MMDKKKMKLSCCAALAGLLIGAGIVSAAVKNQAAEGQPAEIRGDVVEYSMVTNVAQAKGHVVVKKDGAVLKGDSATYNTKTEFGTVTGHVVADKDDMHMTADIVTTEKQNYYLALGNVHFVQQDKKYDGPKAEYTADKDYVRLEKGGTISSADGTLTADFMEGWVTPEHFIGVGHVHIVSPPKQFEGGGDRAEYFGKESGKVVLTGNAWAIQEGNRLKSDRITVYLSDDKKVQTVAESKAVPESGKKTDTDGLDIEAETGKAAKEAEAAGKEAAEATAEAGKLTGEKSSIETAEAK